MNPPKLRCLVALVSLLLIGAVRPAQAQFQACNRNCNALALWQRPACRAAEGDCAAKLTAYRAYMGSVDAGTDKFALPELTKALLRPHYPAANLDAARVATSQRQLGSVAITDCETIYFRDASYTAKVRDGSLSKLAGDSFQLLYHELTHVEQCQQVGGRDNYALMWWTDLGNAVVMDPNPATVHNNQAMEAEANARQATVDAALPDGLVGPVVVDSLAADQASPWPVNQPVSWTAQASGGQGSIEFAFAVRRAGSPTVIANQGFAGQNTFRFAALAEGAYELEARARPAGSSRPPGVKTATFEVLGAGGSGGAPFASECRSGYAMVGARLRVGGYVDSAQAVCARINPDGSWYRQAYRVVNGRRVDYLPGQGPPSIALGQRAGGVGGAAVSLMCNSDWGVRALVGRSGAYVDRLGLDCGPLGATGGGSVGIVGDTGQTVEPRGGAGGAEFALKCAGGQAARGIMGSAGTFIDRLALTCDRLTP